MIAPSFVLIFVQ